jgi:hypothetical protein
VEAERGQRLEQSPKNPEEKQCLPSTPPRHPIQIGLNRKAGESSSSLPSLKSVLGAPKFSSVAEMSGSSITTPTVELKLPSQRGPSSNFVPPPPTSSYRPPHSYHHSQQSQLERSGISATPRLEVGSIAKRKWSEEAKIGGELDTEEEDDREAKRRRDVAPWFSWTMAQKPRPGKLSVPPDQLDVGTKGLHVRSSEQTLNDIVGDLMDSKQGTWQTPNRESGDQNYQQAGNQSHLGPRFQFIPQSQDQPQARPTLHHQSGLTGKPPSQHHSVQEKEGGEQERSDRDYRHNMYLHQVAYEESMRKFGATINPRARVREKTTSKE